MVAGACPRNSRCTDRIDPDFIRFRTLKVIKEMLLYKKLEVVISTRP